MKGRSSIEEPFSKINEKVGSLGFRSAAFCSPATQAIEEESRPPLSIAPTAEVPRIIGREIREAVGSFLGADRPDIWAVHPGGRSVLDRVETGLSLDEIRSRSFYKILEGRRRG
jgi:hypothetical protein